MSAALGDGKVGGTSYYQYENNKSTLVTTWSGRFWASESSASYLGNQLRTNQVSGREILLMNLPKWSWQKGGIDFAVKTDSSSWLRTGRIFDHDGDQLAGGGSWITGTISGDGTKFITLQETRLAVYELSIDPTTFYVNYNLLWEDFTPKGEYKNGTYYTYAAVFQGGLTVSQDGSLITVTKNVLINRTSADAGNSKVAIYEKAANSNTWNITQEFSSIQKYSGFGTNVCLAQNKNYLAIAAPDYQGGRVIIYAKQGNLFQQQLIIDGNTTAKERKIGAGEMCFSNDSYRLIIGCPYCVGNDLVNQGRVKIYKNTQTSWILETELIGPTKTSSYFGSAVSLNSTGNKLAVVSAGIGTNTNIDGPVKIYNLSQ
jgi:hypothetical protein